MKNQFFKRLNSYFLVFLITFSFNKINAQGIFDKVIDNTVKKVGETVEGAVNKTTNKILNGGKSSNGQSSSKNSNSSNSSAYSVGFPLTKNIYTNIDGEYPSGYKPRWRLVNTTGNLEMNVENYLSSRGRADNISIPFSITEYQGKSVIKFSVFSCECAADIQLGKDKVTLSDNAQTFDLTNFRKVVVKSMDDPSASCQTMSKHTHGGWKGNITMQSDRDGNITFSLRMENYSGYGGKLNNLYFKDNVYMANEVTPSRAEENLENVKRNEEEKAKRNEENERYQSNKKYLEQQYEEKLKLVKAKKEANPTVQYTYKGYTLKNVISLNSLIGNNISSSNGTREAYSNAKSNFYTCLGGFDHVIHRNVNTLEPHEKDKEFAISYCTVKELNNFAIQIATYTQIGDVEKLIELGNRLKNIENTSQIVNMNEQQEIIGYLKEK